MQSGHQTDVEATLEKFRQFIAAGYEYFIISDPNEFIYNQALKHELEKYPRVSHDNDPFLIYKLKPESED